MFCKMQRRLVEHVWTRGARGSASLARNHTSSSRVARRPRLTDCSCRLGDDALRLAQRRHAELGAQGVGLSDLRVDATPTALVTTPLPLVAAIPLALLTLVVPISETTITRIRVHYILVYNNMYTRRMTYSLLLFEC